MVLVFAEHQKGNFKKATLEAVTYGAKTAEILNTTCAALVLGEANDIGSLGINGAAKVFQVSNEHLSHFDSQTYSATIANAAKEIGASVVIMSHSSTGKSLLGRVAIRLEAGSVPGVNALPKVDNGFQVVKNVFSGKAAATYQIDSDIKVLSVMGNSIPVESSGAAVSPEALSVEVPAPKVVIKEVKTEDGIVPLPEAELVVSAGRGMKGPENWGIIEELAQTLGATTACSRPVADADWRPHHEHVGQTGVAIRPNLYIAAGISGAIQHLAGVNRSKVIVVINKDPEAPFFKAADYGVVGELFEVVPRLNEALKAFKAS